MPRLPINISKPDVVWGGKVNEILPPYNEIPDEFKSRYGKWNKIFSDWFFKGLPEGTNFIPKPDINKDLAIANIYCVMKSWAPKHEHKEAGVAYLMSLWFEDIQIPVTKNEP